MRLLQTFFIAWMIGSCTPQMTKISSRSPDLFEKQRDPLSEGTGTENNPDLYVKTPQIIITLKSPENETGSLASPDDDRMHLFTDSRPVKKGRVLDIQVVSRQGLGAGAKTNTQASADGPEDSKAAGTPGDRKGDSLEEELLKSLPDLAPADKGSSNLLKKFKMQVMHRLPNGDVLARITRTSNNADQTEEFTAQAKIPADRLISGQPLTTEDLVDVQVMENHSGQLTQRHSSGWEDEYSLRLSGFSEAKSRAGVELEEKRKELTEARERLEQRMKAFATEKREFVSQRDDLNRQRSTGTAKTDGNLPSGLASGGGPLTSAAAASKPVSDPLRNSSGGGSANPTPEDQDKGGSNAKNP